MVEDDPTVRRMIRAGVESVRYRVETFDTPQRFLERFDPDDRPACLVTDLRLPEMSGLQLFEKLHGEGHRLPCILITGFGDVETAVKAIKLGVMEFIQKPLRMESLLERVHAALTQDKLNQAEQGRIDKTRTLLGNLTERERDVLQLVIRGRASKQVAVDLNISAKTVESHRANIMKKIGADSTAELVYLVMSTQIN